MPDMVKPPTLEEYRQAVLEACKRDFGDDERLAVYLKTKEAEEDIKDEYTDNCIYLERGDITVRTFLGTRAALTADILYNCS